MKRIILIGAGILAFLLTGLLFIKRDAISRLLVQDVTPELAGKQAEIGRAHV